MQGATAISSEPKPLRFIRLAQLLQRRSITSSTVYRHVEAGRLPPPVRLGPNTSAWIEHELDAIDKARIAGATEEQIRTLVAELVAQRKQAAA